MARRTVGQGSGRVAEGSRCLSTWCSSKAAYNGNEAKAADVAEEYACVWTPVLPVCLSTRRSFSPVVLRLGLAHRRPRTILALSRLLTLLSQHRTLQGHAIPLVEQAGLAVTRAGWPSPSLPYRRCVACPSTVLQAMSPRCRRGKVQLHTMPYRLNGVQWALRWSAIELEAPVAARRVPQEGEAGWSCWRGGGAA